MGLSQRFERMAKEAMSKTGFWENILPSIRNGAVIPIISDSFRIEQIFRDGSDNNSLANGPSIYEQLTTGWAQSIGYPLEDKENLARVAQYFLVEQKDDPHARTKYLEFLKTVLLDIAGEDQNYAEVAGRLKAQLHNHHFSSIVQQLDYPRIPLEEDALQLLAKFPLPIYITTSPSDFLERALEADAVGKKPRTQICFWSGPVLTTARPQHQTDPEFIPSVMEPLVYHLYGLEDYPQTLVLSEDDYINFLVSMMEDSNTQNPLIPLSLRKALAASHLILLGYRLPDWDFRVLFRFILKFRKDEFSPRGMVIQIKPNEQSQLDLSKSLDYLGRYFDRKKFDIEWTSAESFVKKLWHDWEAYR
jgi:hypothetical protein